MFTGTATSSHSGQISILLGGDNHLFFPTEVERDPQGVALYQSNLTENYMVYGSVLSNTITWVEPFISTSINTVFVKTLTIQDIQDQLLLPASAETFFNPAAQGKLVQLTKEKGIQAIMENTVVDPINNQVSIKYLYKENLEELGENYYVAIKRTKALHAKMSDKPEFPTEIDKYIHEQINNGNYEMIEVEEARKKHQLHQNWPQPQ